MKFYSSTLPEWGKSFGSFISFYRMAAALCEIKDQDQIDKILNDGHVWAPDSQSFYMQKYNISELDWTKSGSVRWQAYDTSEDIFSKKCLKRNINKLSQNYYLKVEELLEIDPFLLIKIIKKNN